MQIKTFVVPILGGEEQNELLNKFLRGNKVLEVEQHLIAIRDTYYWSFCVRYLNVNLVPSSSAERHEKVDYKNVLDEKSFQRFAFMRGVRKKMAENDAVPAYAIFTDAELAEIAKLEEISPQTLVKIDGISQKKIEKYGETFCQMLVNGQTDILPQ